jgi:uncharacterized protein with von Willebrand factor type A (vWA) domain
MLKNTLTLDKLPVAQQTLVANNVSLSASIAKHLQKAQKDLNRLLLLDNPYTESESALIESEAVFASSTQSTLDHISNNSTSYNNFLGTARLPKESYWQQQIASFKKHDAEPKKQEKLRRNHDHLLRTWRKQYDKAYSSWELERIKAFQREFFKKISEWLEHIQQLHNSLKSLGLEPGYLLDFSEGEMSLSDIKQLKKWADYLEADKGIRDLCNLLGKIRQAEQSGKLEIIKSTHMLPEMVFDDHCKEEIIGLKVGRDIEHIVPSELALLADPETDILFDLKYVESRLMCFDMAGLSASTKEEEVEIQQKVADNNKGPLMICIDTSGSMHGEPEIIAKALALYLSTQAKKETRDCYLINFSTGIETLDLSKNTSFGNILRFLQTSFYGGTDVAPAMTHAIEQMQEETYKKADLLIISDFVMGSLPSSTLDAIEEQRIQGNRFYSLCIGNSFMSERLKTHFDSEWIYNPSSSSVTELIKFTNNLSKVECDHTT